MISFKMGQICPDNIYQLPTILAFVYAIVFVTFVLISIYSSDA